MAEAENILTNGDNVTEEQLMDYLKGNLSGDSLHEVEKLMADSAFVNDAVEGLQKFPQNKNLEEYLSLIHI